MGTGTFRRCTLPLAVAACALVVFCGAGCGAGALVVVSLAGGAAAVSGEPQRFYGTQGQDFDETRASSIHSGIHTPDEVVNIMGYPQSKIFTNIGEEWSYRYYIPPTLLRAGLEKILTVRFRDGKVNDVRYTLSAL
jgi:hypothetical protein